MGLGTKKPTDLLRVLKLVENKYIMIDIQKNEIQNKCYRLHKAIGERILLEHIF